MTLEEIQELLSEHDNRISFLENSLPGSAMSYHPEEETEELVVEAPEPWNKNQWNIINQLRGEILYLKNKIIKHLDKPKQGDRL